MEFENKEGGVGVNISIVWQARVIALSIVVSAITLLILFLKKTPWLFHSPQSWFLLLLPVGVMILGNLVAYGYAAYFASDLENMESLLNRST